MKQTTRLLALSALVLAVVLAAIGAPALNAPSVAFAQEQEQVPIAPVITAQRSGADTINLSWEAVTGAVSYELYAHHPVTGWMRNSMVERLTPLTATTFAHENLDVDTTLPLSGPRRQRRKATSRRLYPQGPTRSQGKTRPTALSLSRDRRLPGDHGNVARSDQRHQLRAVRAGTKPGHRLAVPSPVPPTTIPA